MTHVLSDIYYKNFSHSAGRWMETYALPWRPLKYYLSHYKGRAVVQIITKLSCSIFVRSFYTQVIILMQQSTIIDYDPLMFMCILNEHSLFFFFFVFCGLHALKVFWWSWRGIRQMSHQIIFKKKAVYNTMAWRCTVFMLK